MIGPLTGALVAPGITLTYQLRVRASQGADKPADKS